MENKKITQKLAAYTSLSAGLFLIGNVSADAQIVYTDIADVNVNINSGLHLIDLNNDGVDDIGLKVDQIINTYTSTSSSSSSSSSSKYSKGTYMFDAKIAKVLPLQSNELGLVSSSNIYLKSFMQGSVINQNNAVWNFNSVSNLTSNFRLLKAKVNYMSISSSSTYTSSYSGGWANGTTAFAGLKFDISGEYHFAWLRFRVDSATAFTLLDYAYRVTPNDSITAGETGVFIKEYSQLDADVFSNKNSIKINNADAANYAIYNLSGQLIKYGVISSNAYSLDFDRKGVFIVRLIKGNKQFTRKIIL